jgi:5-formyltetrahydrofolate cyclo-ligase
LSAPGSKASERARLRTIRDGIDSSELARLSSAIADNLIDNNLLGESNLIASYHSVGSEVSTSRLHELLASRAVGLALPRVHGNRLEFIRVDTHTRMHRSAFGIDEPDGDAIELSAIDLIVVPGIAFDKRGYRLGYGGGFYDRFLAEVASPTVGLCAETMLVDTLPFDDHDKRVDTILTEQRCLEV